MNTRTYPRTTRDAFKGLDYACSVERPAPTGASEIAVWLALAVGALAALIAGMT